MSEDETATNAGAPEPSKEDRFMPESTEEITYHAVEKDGVITALWEMQGRKHLRTINPESDQGQEILRLYTSQDPEPTYELLPHISLSGNDQLALAIIDAEIRLVSITPDGECRFIDAAQTPYSILYLMTSETIALQRAVEEFEALINDPRVREEDCQAFFERNPDFILNDDYKQAHPHLALATSHGEELIPDFVLEPIDQTALCDRLELKLPSAQAFVLKKKQNAFLRCGFGSLRLIASLQSIF
jgi:hypothetical protein